MPPPPVRNFFWLLLLGTVLLTIALVVRSGIFARKNPGQPLSTAMREALASEQKPELSTADEFAIEKQFPTARTLPSGLRYVLRTPGTGDARPHPGQKITVRYTGRLLDGTPIDGSEAHGGSFTFTAGRGKVIKGWDEAILEMKKGEKRTLIIPYWLGYGANGRPPKIPPMATLIFDIELVDFR
ncbi:MAG: FKBP-type peptidyl-prolyl cis-trans isomerase [Verrucomicrobiota bacterium]|nr:FKBP-type peptidyl-prolyl cis-trans isomerase [Verrucomicrobiota bacterium]